MLDELNDALQEALESLHESASSARVFRCLERDEPA